MFVNITRVGTGTADKVYVWWMEEEGLVALSDFYLYN